MSDSDSDLLDRCRRGDETAWRELVSRHTRKVFGLAYRFVGRLDVAEDLTQEVFVKVYQSLDRYQEPAGAFSAWITTVARNHVIDHYRKRREERLHSADSQELVETAASAAESPLHALEREERMEFVRRGVRSLPADLREPLVLCDLQGVSYEDVAETLGIPLGTVKSRINRARVELAKRLLARSAAYRP